MDQINRIISSDEETFDNVEEKIREIITDNIVATHSQIEDVNFCCNQEEKNFLLELAIKLKKEFPDFSFKDICIAVIHTYYGVQLAEQTGFINVYPLNRNHNNEILFTKDRLNDRIYYNYKINTYADNIKAVYYLYLRLGSPSTTQDFLGDIITSSGDNLSRRFRVFVLQPSQQSSIGIKRKWSEEPKKNGGLRKNRTRKSRRKGRKSKRNSFHKSRRVH